MFWFLVGLLLCVGSFAKEQSILDHNQLNDVMNELKLLRKEVEENKNELKAVKLELEETKRHRTCQCEPNSTHEKSKSERNEVLSEDTNEINLSGAKSIISEFFLT